VVTARRPSPTSPPKPGSPPETVYSAFRNKAALLHRTWDVTVGGDDRDVPMLDRPELRALFDEPDLRARFTAFAVFDTAAMRRTARLHVAVRGAAASDRTAAAMLAEIDRQRRESMAGHATAAAATGQLAVSAEECRNVLWSTTDGTLWHRLVECRGWSDERYAAWLGRLWVASFVVA
jgi:hypothetical protein